MHYFLLFVWLKNTVRWLFWGFFYGHTQLYILKDFQLHGNQWARSWEPQTGSQKDTDPVGLGIFVGCVESVVRSHRGTYRSHILSWRFWLIPEMFYLHCFCSSQTLISGGLISESEHLPTLVHNTQTYHDIHTLTRRLSSLIHTAL